MEMEVVDLDDNDIYMMNGDDVDYISVYIVEVDFVQQIIYQHMRLVVEFNCTETRKPTKKSSKKSNRKSKSTKNIKPSNKNNNSKIRDMNINRNINMNRNSGNASVIVGYICNSDVSSMSNSQNKYNINFALERHAFGQIGELFDAVNMATLDVVAPLPPNINTDSRIINYNNNINNTHKHVKQIQE